MFLSQAGVACTGSDRDELVVDEVMRLFEASAKNKKGVSTAVPPLRVQDQARWFPIIIHSYTLCSLDLTLQPLFLTERAQGRDPIRVTAVTRFGSLRCTRP